MQPIALLMDEHRTIEKVLDALEAFAAGPAAAAPGARAETADFARFLADFADRIHHGKEEDLLFRAMAEAGMPKEAGPIAVMLSEHREGRSWTGVLARVAGGTDALGDDEARDVRQAARAYVPLLRAHIQKEDQILYPMADRFLAEGTWRSLEAAFEAFQAGHAAEDRELRALADDLTRRHPRRPSGRA